MTNRDILVDQLVKTTIKLLESQNNKDRETAFNICNKFETSHVTRFACKSNPWGDITISYIPKKFYQKTRNCRLLKYEDGGHATTSLNYVTTLHMLIYQSGISTLDLEKLLWELL